MARWITLNALLSILWFVICGDLVNIMEYKSFLIPEIIFNIIVARGK